MLLSMTYGFTKHDAVPMLDCQQRNFVIEIYETLNEDENDPSYVELRLDFNELTQSTYLKILDYSDFDDHRELHSLFSGRNSNLTK